MYVPSAVPYLNVTVVASPPAFTVAGTVAVVPLALSVPFVTPGASPTVTVHVNVALFPSVFAIVMTNAYTPASLVSTIMSPVPSSK